MKINQYFLRLSVILIVIFGGSFVIRYFRTGELSEDQIPGMLLGVVLLIGAWIWRKYNKGSS